MSNSNPQNLSSTQNEPITGIVLAGGLSSRLGEDKAALVLENGEDLLRRSVRLLLEVTPRVLVVGRSVPELEELPGVECMADAWPRSGPAGGIATGLRASGTACLALSCDLPFMNAEVLQGLIKAWSGRKKGTLLCAYKQRGTGKVENMVGIYAGESLPWFEATLEKRLLKISLVLPAEKQEFVEYAFEDSLPFFNINYPADLLLAREYLRLKKALL